MPSVRIDPSHFSPDIRSFIELLHEHRVRYLIVGGEAVIVHGHARLTGDVDFFFRRDAENADRLYAALEEFWGGDVPGVNQAPELTEEGLVLQFGVPPNRLDLVNAIDGVAFGDAWSRRIEATLPTERGEVPVHYIGLEDLIANKETAGRPKDLDDLAYLRRVR